MTTEQIIEGNKLIAEYMDIPKCKRCDDCGGYQYGPGIIHLPAEMRYHESWDWIMPVIKKIAQANENIIPYWRIISPINTLDLSPVWEGVVEIIKNKT